MDELKELLIETNRAEISGKVIGDLQFSHHAGYEKFYEGFVFVKRNSDVEDLVPILVPERLLTEGTLLDGTHVHIKGYYSSRMRLDPQRNQSRLYSHLYVKELEICEDEYPFSINKVSFIGTICKPVIYRVTPLGREIADVFLAVNRVHTKGSDYIPCILWNENALKASELPVGTKVAVSGRIQSREYIKKLSETEFEKRIAYEVSLGKLEFIEE